MSQVSCADGTNVVRVFKEAISLAIKNKEHPPDEVLASCQHFPVLSCSFSVFLSSFPYLSFYHILSIFHFILRFGFVCVLAEAEIYALLAEDGRPSKTDDAAEVAYDEAPAEAVAVEPPLPPARMPGPGAGFDYT